MKVTIIGAGKVGRWLARTLVGTGVRPDLRAARQGIPTQRIDGALLILAVRDQEIPRWAGELALARVVSSRTAVVHVAGAWGAEVLAPLRPHAAGLGQAHPALSFPTLRATPRSRRGMLLMTGDAIAVRRAARMGRALGLVPREVRQLDQATYHAACVFVANGAAALAGVGVDLLVGAGVSAADAPRIAGSLLSSVADNVAKLGMPAALSGPVRRGDVAVLERHLAALGARHRELVPLYAELARAQLSAARELAESAPDDLDHIAQLIQRHLVAAHVDDGASRTQGRGSRGMRRARD